MLSRIEAHIHAYWDWTKLTENYISEGSPGTCPGSLLLSF